MESQINKTELGMVACGDPNTAEAAIEIFKEGGNAFDAIVAAFFMSCVSEPVLSSLAGGGYMLAKESNIAKPKIYDFFCQTPIQKKHPDEIEFFSKSVDFGVAEQEFHIGHGSIATPGCVAGMFAIHRDLGSLPMTRLVEPAIEKAKNGIIISPFQAYAFAIIHPIFTASEGARANYQVSSEPHVLLRVGDRLKQPNLAHTLKDLAQKTDAWFYRGELARELVEACQNQGGQLSLEDLKSYQVKVRKPLTIAYRNADIHLNPPPSTGGILIAFALKLLEKFQFETTDWHQLEHLELLSLVMEQTNKARIDHDIQSVEFGKQIFLDDKLIQLYQQKIHQRASCARGTTHISTADQKGNLASLTVSNGEGCGYMLGETGIMLNNILGEEDLNPKGFHNWKENQRMTSMMTPTLIKKNNQSLVLGSGGSNRIRTAILQVIHNLVDFDFPLEKAINSPRIHLENQLLSIENSEDYCHSNDLRNLLGSLYPEQKNWPSPNMFFGGVHSVSFQDEPTCLFGGVGDMRRNGIVKLAKAN